jgi:hypothetical protein
MSDSIKITGDKQPVHISQTEEQIDVALTKETINISSGDGKIDLTIKEENFDFSSPLVLAVPEWPFSPNPKKVEGLTKVTPVIVDQVVMNAYYRVIKWLFLITDETNDLAVTSEIKCMRHTDDVHYMEYAIMGDSGQLLYDLDAVVDGGNLNLIITSRYDGGDLTVRTSRIGIFS